MDLSSIPGMGLADYFLNPGKPYKAAEKELEDYWQKAFGISNPFMEAGKGQLPILTGAENQLLNPIDLLNKWSSAYTVSPYAKQEMERAKSSGLDAASSMGLMGSSTALNNIQTGASQIMNQDRDKFLQNLMQKFMTGIGIGRDIYGRGADVAKKLSESALDVGGEMAKAKYGEKMAPAQSMFNLASLVSGLFGG